MTRKAVLETIITAINTSLCQSSRLYFRETMEGDLPYFYKMYNSVFYKKYFIGSDINITHDELSIILSNKLIAIIVNKKSQNIIGINYIWKLEENENSPIYFYDIALLQDYIGKGFGIEACLIYLNIYFQAGFQNVFSRVLSNNIMSKSPIQKLGFLGCVSPIIIKKTILSWEYFLLSADRFYQFNRKRMRRFCISK
jgi:hypothetical protein